MYYECGTSDRQERPDSLVYGNRSATGRGGWIQKTADLAQDFCHHPSTSTSY